MEIKKYTCIVCPKSCTGTLTVKEDGTFLTEGFGCPNGEKYAVNEYTDPKRVLTTTVRIDHAEYALLPVVSDGEISRKVFKDCMDRLYNVKVEAPVKEGDIIVEDILHTGVNIIAARTLK